MINKLTPDQQIQVDAYAKTLTDDAIKHIQVEAVTDFLSQNNIEKTTQPSA